MKKENKTKFCACIIPEKVRKQIMQENITSVHDVCIVLLHNQTIINEKLNKILNKLNI